MSTTEQNPAVVADEEKPAFALAGIGSNASGWGPTGQGYAERFQDIPFAPYSKRDRVGRISDWNYTRERRWQAQAAAESGTTFTYTAEKSDGFAVVDTKPKPKSKWGGGGQSRRGGRGGFGGGYRSFPQGKAGDKRGGGGQQRNNYRRGGGRGGRGGRGRGRGRGGNSGWRRPNGVVRGGWSSQQWGNQETKQASIAIGEHWPQPIEPIELSALGKAKSEMPEDGGETLKTVGQLRMFDKRYDRVMPNTQIKLTKTARVSVSSTTASQDPILQELMEEGAGTVYATDVVLAALMAAHRSVNAWDIIVRKRGGRTVLEKRPDSQLDQLTVNENWNEVSNQEEGSINHPTRLSAEATAINHHFSQQVLSGPANKKAPVLDFGPSPFSAESIAARKAVAEKARRAKAAAGDGALFGDEIKAAGGGSAAGGGAPGGPSASKLTSSAFRYRRWRVSEKIVLVARTELNAFTRKADGTDVLCTVRALNEFDPRLSGANNVQWKRTLGTQMGAVVATEMKNNSNKVSRWAAQTVLAGADVMKVGFVARLSPQEANHHVILKTTVLKPRQFAAQMNVTFSNMWGSLCFLLEKINDLEDDADYVLLKDPNHARLALYAIPDGMAERLMKRGGSQAAADDASAALVAAATRNTESLV